MTRSFIRYSKKSGAIVAFDFFAATPAAATFAGIADTAVDLSYQTRCFRSIQGTFRFAFNASLSNRYSSMTYLLFERRRPDSIRCPTLRWRCTPPVVALGGSTSTQKTTLSTSCYYLLRWRGQGGGGGKRIDGLLQRGRSSGTGPTKRSMTLTNPRPTSRWYLR